MRIFHKIFFFVYFIMNVRSRDWCFTVNNYTSDGVSRVQTVMKDALYGVFGYEEASTGTKHLQGYIYFENAKSFSKIQKLLPLGTHIEKTNGTPQQASQYCKKEGKYEEFGTLPQPSGKRNDLMLVKEMIKDGNGMNEIIEVASNYQCLKTAELLLKYREQKRTWKPKVIWLWGASGSGKTKKAYDDMPNLYRKTNSTGKWWDGYDGHSDVLIDDLKDDSPQMYSTLLELLDRYDCRVETKGGSRQFLAKRIYVTSIRDPIVMFGNYDYAVELKRRIDRIEYIKS